MSKFIKVPTQSTMMKRIADGIKGGLAGGVPSAVATVLTGSPAIGNILGSTIGSMFVDETTGRIIVVNGWHDAIQSLAVIGR